MRSATSIERQAAMPADVVRHTTACTCGAMPGVRCTAGGDHLGRWLAAYSAGRIRRGEVAQAIATLTVMTRWSVIPDQVLTR